MGDLAGRLNIQLQRLNGCVQVALDSSRSTSASRVFIGKTVDETLTRLPTLFSVCATAQACACASACEAAMGLTPDPGVVETHCLLVDAETVKEHLWRMLLDWPRFLDEPPRAQSMSEAMRAYRELQSLIMASSDPTRPGTGRPFVDGPEASRYLDELIRICAQQVFGSDPRDWLARIRSPDDLFAWAKGTDTVAARLVLLVEGLGWASAGRSRVTALPPLSAVDLERLLSGVEAEQFTAQPTWQGETRESSPFTRQRKQAPVGALISRIGNGLLPRLVALLLELASLLQGLRSRLQLKSMPCKSLGEGVSDGVGIAQVPAARGLLVHRAAVERGRIRDYSILAPTEWNFHPRGVVVCGLSSLPVADTATLQRQASLFVTVVDPCVDYTVTVS